MMPPWSTSSAYGVCGIPFLIAARGDNNNRTSSIATRRDPRRSGYHLASERGPRPAPYDE